MEVKFKSIALKDFLSFKDEEYEFEDGIYLIQGDNSLSATASSNGSGKSGLFVEALVWGLYGTSLRSDAVRLPVNHIVRNGAKSAVVSITLDIDGEELVVTRERTARRTNTLVEFKGAEYEDDEAEEMLSREFRLTKQQFCNLVVLSGQYPSLFVSASDTDRKELLLDIVMDREQMAGIVALTSAEKAEFTSQLKETENKILLLQSQRDGYSDEVERLVREQDELAKLDVKKEMADLQADVHAQEKLCQRLPAAVEPNTEDLEAELAEAVAEGAKAEAALQAKLNSIEKKKGLLNDVKRKCERELARVDRDIEAQEELGRKGVCPTCGSEASKDEKVLEELTKLRKDILTNIKDADEKITTFSVAQLTEKKNKSAAILKLREKERKLSEDMKEASKEYILASSSSHAAHSKLESLRGQLNVLEERDKNRKSREAKIAGRLESVHSCIKKVDSDILEAAALTEILDKAVRYLTFWRKAFGKDIPSLFVESVVPRVNKHIAFFMDKLAGGDISVTITPFKHTSTGSVQEKFGIEIVNTHGSNTFGGDSKGEQTRIKLAVSLGLIKFFRSCNIFSCNLLVADEILDGIDYAGAEAVMKVIRNDLDIASTYVVSHSSELTSLFSRSVLVRKGPEGSRIV